MHYEKEKSNFLRRESEENAAEMDKPAVTNLRFEESRTNVLNVISVFWNKFNQFEFFYSIIQYCTFLILEYRLLMQRYWKNDAIVCLSDAYVKVVFVHNKIIFYVFLLPGLVNRNCVYILLVS